MTPISAQNFASTGEGDYGPPDMQAMDRADVTEALGQELNARMQEAREQAELHARNSAVAAAESDRWRSVMRACEAGLKSLVADANRGQETPA